MRAFSDNDCEAERAALKARLDNVVAMLVTTAKPDWPVSADHCFLRIAYDNAMGCRWDGVVARPAWRHLPLDRLATAIAVLERVVASGRPALQALNAASLDHRRRARRAIKGQP